MGYTTEFEGQIEVSPPLNAKEVEFLNKFNGTRRMNRSNGPYFVDGSGDFGQGGDTDIISYNEPPAGQPGLWCGWEASSDGRFIRWDGGEKFYASVEWMQYLIDHFLKPGAIAKSKLPFLQANHTLNGVIYAQGEDSDDKWRLVVEANVVTPQVASFTYA